MRHGAGAYLVCLPGGARGLRAGRHVPESGGAGLKFNTSDGLKLGLPADKQAVGVTRLDPPLEKLGWYGEVDCRIVDAVKLYAAKPAGKDFFAEFSAQSRLYPRPSINVTACGSRWSPITKVGHTTAP